MKVLDLTTMLSGPYATMLLADLGADVVKVERPTGDVTRAVGPFKVPPAEGGLGGYFQSVNRGKRSIVLDLKAEPDRDRFLSLVAHADVVVENFSPGVMERLGLAYERLAELNPRLVYGALRGFGDPRSGSSPYLNWPAYDVVAQAMGGFAGITGPLGGPPFKAGPGIGDIATGMFLSLGIVAAVREAERTGRGQFVDVAMYDAMLAMAERIVYRYSFAGVVSAPEGNAHPLLCPFDIFPVRDGHVAIAAPSDRHWRELACLMGHPEMAEDERYATNGARVRHAEQVRGVITEWLSDKSKKQVEAELGGLVPFGPVQDVAEIFDDPHTAIREMLVEVEEPGAEEGVTIAGQPIKFTRSPARPAVRGPRLGEDDLEDVLAQWSATGGRS